MGKRKTVLEIMAELETNPLTLEAMKEEAERRGMAQTTDNYVKLYREWGPGKMTEKEKKEKTTGEKLEIYGVPDTTDGILRPQHITIKRNGEVVRRCIEFEIKATIDGVPTVKMVSYSPDLDIRLEGVEIDEEIRGMRIFEHLKDTLKNMDYDFQLAWKKKGYSWKTATPKELKDGLDKVYGHLNTVFEQAGAGERNQIDVGIFAIKVANYAMLLADRIDIILKGKRKNG